MPAAPSRPDFNPVSVIARKRDGQELSAADIQTVIAGYTAGELPDYQMAALAMAIYWRGMTVNETSALTDSMLRSGVILSWPTDSRPIVDKHSTGGIGDKVSLLLAPLLACAGLAVPMISGRGLGPTGGTLDKLEAIPGYRTDLTLSEIQHLTQSVGCVITGASAEIAPADRKLYGLRDVTGTVASIPLITASIMSKKLAEGLQALVLDVKHGNGAFMKTLDQARALAQSLVNTGRRMGVATSAFITDMNQPLGQYAGNAWEVWETLEALRGKGPADLWEVTEALGAELLVGTRVCDSSAAARRLLQNLRDSGRACEKFHEMVRAQGGDLSGLRLAPPIADWTAPRSGWLTRIDTERLGWIVIALGGGRRQLGDPLDHSVGLQFLARLGDRVETGQPLVRWHCDRSQWEQASALMAEVFEFGDSPVPSPALIVERIG